MKAPLGPTITHHVRNAGKPFSRADAFQPRLLPHLLWINFYVSRDLLTVRTAHELHARVWAAIASGRSPVFEPVGAMWDCGIPFEFTTPV